MRYIFLVILFSCLSFFAKAQENRPYRHYATQKVHQRLLKEDPKLSEELLKIERKIAKNNKIEDNLKDGYLPLYFHILYSNEAEMVSEAQIMSQIEVLNNDFALSIQPDEIDIQPAYDFKADGNTEKYEIKLSKDKRGSLDIKFCLAYSNNNKNGIHYVSTQVSEWGADDAIKSKKQGGADAEQPGKYINVWIANLADTISGYAQMPGGPDDTDGIVIDYRFFGVGGTAQAPYDLGRTMTHLLGNYLGLYDLWSETSPCGDDKVADTPVHKNPNTGCPQYLHVSSCVPGEAEMTMNFMDNTDDVCQSLFTVGQMQRMYKMLSPDGPRNGLLSSISKCDLPEETFRETVLRSAKEVPQVQLSPNPTRDLTNLEITHETGGSGQIQIYSSLGKLVYSRTLELDKGYNEVSIPTSNWPAGMYLLHVQIDAFKAVKSLSVVHN